MLFIRELCKNDDDHRHRRQWKANEGINNTPYRIIMLASIGQFDNATTSKLFWG